jgi:formyl-CoA transferase
MIRDPHFVARNAIVQVPNEEHGSVKMQNCFPVLSDTPSSIHRAASRFPGEHNADVLGERLGLGGEELSALQERGII